MNAQKNNVALSHPYHEGKWCSKFGKILPSGLGGDSVTDIWTDVCTKQYLLSYPFDLYLAHSANFQLHNVNFNPKMTG